MRDAARLVAHRGGPHFGSQSKCVKEGDGHTSHGGLQCLHTPLALVGRHVFVSSGVPAWRPPILDNGGVVFGGGAGFSSMLESAVGPVSVLDPGPTLFVEKALPSCSSLFPFTSLPVFPVSVGEREAEVHRAVAEGVLRGTSSSSTIASPHEVAQSSKGSVSTAVAPKNLRGQPFWLTLGKGLPWRTLSMCMMLWMVAERSCPGTRYSTPGIPTHGHKEVLATPRSSWTPSSLLLVPKARLHEGARVFLH